MPIRVRPLPAPDLRYSEGMNTEPLLYTAETFFDHPDFLASGWESLFPGHSGLNFEIGMGYGHFLAWLAPRFPAQAFVGVDIVSKVLRGAEQRLRRALASQARPNVCISKQDALMMLRELFPPASLDHLYILFPDPWFKERHEHRRMLREDTLPLFASCLKTGGRLIFVTDDPPYAESALALLNASPLFEATAFPEIDVRTKYEKKWLQQAKPIHRLAYARLPQADLPDTGTWRACPRDLCLPLADWQPAHFAALPQACYPLQFAHQGWYFKLHQPEATPAGLSFPLVIAEPRSLAQHSRLLLPPDGQIRIADGPWLPYLQRREQVMQALAAGLGHYLKEGVYAL